MLSLESFIRDTVPKDNATLIGQDDIAYGFTLFTQGDALRALKKKEDNPRLSMKDIVARYVVGLKDIRQEVGQRLRTACASDVLRKSFDTLKIIYDDLRVKRQKLIESVDKDKSLVDAINLLYSNCENEKLRKILAEDLRQRTEYPADHFYHGEIICKTQTPINSLTPPLLVFNQDEPIGASTEINFMPYPAIAGGKKVAEKYLFNDDGFHATVCRVQFYSYDKKAKEAKVKDESFLGPEELGIID
jgi:hypothetical protein